MISDQGLVRQRTGRRAGLFTTPYPLITDHFRQSERATISFMTSLAPP
jgi:hypothetical protein